MTKRHLSDQQIRRIDNTQTEKLDKENQQTATVIKRFGKQAVVELASGKEVRAEIRQNISSIVVGDRVAIELQPHRVITALHPRENTLSRKSRFGQLKPLAANITQIFLVLAVEPKSTGLLIDSYLVAAAMLNVKLIIAINKMDLCVDEKALQSEYQSYADLGYQILWTSKNDDETKMRLLDSLSNEVSVFVGQSGVGKSTLIKMLLPDEPIEVSSISKKQKLGRHTTTSATLYRLENGSIIDSPGVREFYLHDYTPQDLFSGFRELQQFYGQCQFRNCTHKNEKGCVLEEISEAGKVGHSRLASFLTLLERIGNE